MSIKARIVFSKKEHEPLDVEFAFPVHKGDSFWLGKEDGTKQIYQVGGVSHVPVASGSGDQPSIIVIAEPLKTSWVSAFVEVLTQAK